jgi:hypothetical protein
MARRRRRSSPGRRAWNSVKRKISELLETPEFIVRMRWILFVLAFLSLFLGFQAGDDWFVREFANYDWARAIGY